MPAGDRLRTPCRFCLPVDLLGELDAEAMVRGIPVERLVDEIALTVLPVLLAEAARDYIAESIRAAAELDAAENEPDASTENAEPRGVGVPGSVKDVACTR